MMVLFSDLLSGCDFNWSMQHLTSNQREKDLADEEIPKKDAPHRSREGDDVGQLAAG
jgi:hypothetical protein